jgi:hypothetical protein
VAPKNLTLLGKATNFEEKNQAITSNWLFKKNLKREHCCKKFSSATFDKIDIFPVY